MPIIISEADRGKRKKFPAVKMHIVIPLIKPIAEAACPKPFNRLAKIALMPKTPPQERADFPSEQPTKPHISAKAAQL